MTSTEVLQDAFGRVRGVVHAVVEDLTPEELATRLGGKANSIAWLVWHLTRVQDDHVAAIEGVEQAWTASGWATRFGLALDVSDTGYGHGPREVEAVKADAELLVGYHDAVYTNTMRFLANLADADLHRVVDDNWDPPVTMGVRLVSVVDDDMQHAGQAAFVRGLL
jgi:uncharacterized damage-inducible protein DinB